MDKKLALKLMNIQQTLDAPKDKTNSFGHYNYRSAESILQALKKPLVENKCALMIDDNIENIDGTIYIKAVVTLIDTESGESCTSQAFAREAATKSGMDVSQITGATSSYARKYALNGMFCIDDNKDFDTDEAYRIINNPDAAKNTTRSAKTKKSQPESTVANVEEFIAKMNACKSAKELTELWKANPAFQKDANAFSECKRIGTELKAKETA